jgi:hypothetical protein
VSGFDGVIVRNGTVIDFPADVRVAGARNTELRTLRVGTLGDVVSDGRGLGIELVGADDTVIAGGSAVDTNAVRLSGSDRTTFVGVNMRALRANLELANGSDDTVVRLSSLQPGDRGTQGLVVSDSRRTIVRRTAIVGGTSLRSAPGTQILDSSLSPAGRFSGTFTATSNRVTVRDSSFSGPAVFNGERNVVAFNQFAGATGDPNTALMVSGGVGNVVRGNTVRGGGVGIWVTSPGALVALNRVEFTAPAGINVNGAGSTVRFNTVIGTGTIASIGGNGIGVSGAEITVQGNVAHFNARLGINAPGAIDGGDNQAAANGDPRQCVGVVCR